MKIAAAEAQWTTCEPCSFSAFQIGGGKYDETPTKIIKIPHLLSVLATGTWDGQVRRAQPAEAQYQQQYGPGNYVPNVFIQYWSMRVMAYLGALCSCSRCGARGCSIGASSRRRSGSCSSAMWAIVTPFLMNTAGWLLTENGRQPWIVQGLMQTKTASRRPSARPRSGSASSSSSCLYGLLARRRRHADAPLRAQGARRGRRRRARRADDDGSPDPTTSRVPALTY